MTKVVGFAMIDDIDTPHYIATSYRNDNNSGQYVSLVEYQELERMIALDTTLQVELGKLRTLLKRWNEIAPTVFNIFNGNAHWKSDDLTQLIQDTKETLR